MTTPPLDSGSDSAAPGPGVRRLVALDRAEALELLAGISLGRIVFTRDALPAIRPVNHLVDDGEIIVRTHGDSALIGQTSRSGIGGVVVAYEADQIDPETHEGWSVVVTGYARRMTDPEKTTRYQTLLRPWVATAMDMVVHIRPDLITGFRLI